jgi:hypothetical protein
MIDLLTTTQTVLGGAGLETWLIRASSGASVVCFEDVSVMGFAGIFPSTAALLTEWKRFESEMLDRFAVPIRNSGEKAWNVYTVLLTTEPASPEHRRSVRWIEEDLSRTRKLAGCDLQTRPDVVEALLPLMPVQQQAAIQADDANDRLLKRIGALAPSVEKIALNDSVTVQDVVQVLMGDKI